MFNRYSRSAKLTNDLELYKDLLNRKKIKNIKYLETFSFRRLTEENLQQLESYLLQIEPGDTLYKISEEVYGSPEYAWLICYTNSLPNELSIKVGDYIRIYIPLNKLLELF